MPVQYLTADAVRVAEHATGDLLVNGTLMRRASTGVAQAVIGELKRTGGCYGRAVGLVIGAGNNGGDALYAGAILARRGVRCSAVLLVPGRAHEGGLAALLGAGGRVVDTLPESLDLVIDGVLGIGGTGPLRPAAADVFAQVTAPIVAVDLPSGVDADTGVVNEPSVRATITVTFGAYRNAHLLAAPRCGRIDLVDIGLPPTESAPDGLFRLTDAEVAALWPVPGPADDKYTQGVIGIVAGSARYPGAAILASGAAVSATSGMTRYVGSAADQVISHYPEVVAVNDLADAGKVQAWAVGPGMGTGDEALEILRTVLATDLPVLVDADGLTVLAENLDLVRDRQATELGATVLLKGRITLVATPEGLVYGNDAGSSWAATAGAGDVLTGIAGSLLAAGLEPVVAGACAARVHALAARQASGGAPVGASALLAAVHPVIGELRGA